MRLRRTLWVPGKPRALLAGERMNSYRMAAGQGEPGAQSALGFMYDIGRDVRIMLPLSLGIERQPTGVTPACKLR